MIIASNIEGEQETELLAEYEALNKQQQKLLPRSSMNNLSPNKRRNVRQCLIRKRIFFDIYI
jgi:hypothetical protein